MKNKKNFIIIFSIIIATLVAVGVFSAIKIFENKTKESSTITVSKIDKTQINQSDSNMSQKTVNNENFESLICQSAMLVKINKAIEESKTTEIQDSEKDIQEKKPEEAITDTQKPYYIKVNYSANTVTVYGLDEAGNYTVPVKAMVCSTGVATPRSGVYGTQNKYQWKILNGGVYGQYSTRITGSILFHSVPYSTSSKNALISKYYDKLGTTASAGCVRLPVDAAKWIYDNCPLGTKVEFYASSNPGPLGKPSAKKIAEYPDNIKCWDPTDPDGNNPWHTYKEAVAPTPEPTAIPTPVLTPSPTATPVPTKVPTPSPTATPTPEPTKITTPVPTATPIPSPTATPTPELTKTPTPSSTVTPTPNKTVTPTPVK